MRAPCRQLESNEFYLPSANHKPRSAGLLASE
jgi:hypothetical protein